jgi:formylglycine-generating enzyme required for sulfatase activity
MDPFTVMLAIALADGLKKVGEKLVAPLLEPAKEQIEERALRGYKNAKKDQALQDVIAGALEAAGAPQKDDDKMMAWAKEMGIARLQTPKADALRRQVARAVIGHTQPDMAPPDDLVFALRWPPSKADDLSNLLTSLRQGLIKLDDWHPLITYADEQAKKGQLQEMLSHLADLSDAVIQTEAGKALRVFIQGMGISPDRSEELKTQIAGYLAWVEEAFGVITLRGIEQSGRQVVELPLDSVYVPLQAEHTMEKHEQISQSMEAESKEKNTRKVELNQVLSLANRLIITGGPGSGKTTVLQHIAWSLAHAIRYDREAIAEEKIGLGTPLPLPIYVPLSLYASYRRNLPPEASGEQKTLAAFIADYLLQNQTNLDLDRGFFADLLRDEQRVLLLLDGLDEVPDEQERVIIRQDIENLVAGKKNLRVVVTSRTAAYQGRAVLAHSFQHVRVLPIGDELIESMIMQAYGAIYPQTPQQAEAKADDLIKGIRRLEKDRQRSIGENAIPLVSTPLMVRMLLIVHFNNRRLPDQRADLYQKAIDAMLRPDYTLDETVTEEIERRVGGSLAMNREMLQLLAFQMHSRGEKQGREIGEDDIREILCSEPTYQPFVDDLIEQTCQRGTLLEERGGMYRFIHLSFQEFLSGRYLVERLRDVESIATFLEDGIVLEDWWREPILLMIGYLDITSPRVAREMLIRLAGLDEDSLEKVDELPLKTQLASVELAAIAYHECQNQLSSLQESLKQRLRFFFQRETQVQAPLPILTLASAADSLDKFGYLPENLHTFVPIPDAQSPKFHIGRYPVTNAQYQRFLEADDFAQKEYWVDFPKFSAPDEDTGEIKPMGNWGEDGWEWLQDTLQDEDASPDGKVVLPCYWNEPRFGIVRKGNPVVGVIWYEANAYCKWLLVHWDELPEAEQNIGLKPTLIRLPTEQEWALAAGGEEPSGRYPWDEKGQATEEKKEILRRANVDESGIGCTTPVAMYPLGVSPHGVWDMGGNIWEWQANYYSDDHRRLALRGSAFYNSNHDLAHAASRVRDLPYRNRANGFRVVLAAHFSPEHTPRQNCCAATASQTVQ